MDGPSATPPTTGRTDRPRAIPRPGNRGPALDDDRTGQVAVVFLSQRRGEDDAGYHAAAAVMDGLAAVQPGYRGIDSARGPDGFGITVSWWADEAAALAWRAHPDHAAIRDRGRHDWYDRYAVAVATVDRSYRWRRDEVSPAVDPSSPPPRASRGDPAAGA